MTPKFDELYETLMEDLSQQGKGMLANRGGGASGASKPMGSAPTPAQTQNASVGSNPSANLSGQSNNNQMQSNNPAMDFNQILNEPDDNKAAENVIQHLTQSGINANDPKFAQSPEGQAIGQRIVKNPKFADALNMAQQNLMKNSVAATQKAFQGQQVK